MFPPSLFFSAPLSLSSYFSPQSLEQTLGWGSHYQANSKRLLMHECVILLSMCVCVCVALTVRFLTVCRFHLNRVVHLWRQKGKTKCYKNTHQQLLFQVSFSYRCVHLADSIFSCTGFGFFFLCETQMWLSHKKTKLQSRRRLEHFANLPTTPEKLKNNRKHTRRKNTNMKNENNREEKNLTCWLSITAEFTRRHG